jgi:hypothetical protein
VEWTEAALERLVNDGVAETTQLEFKACDAIAKTQGKKTDLAKDVAAMANAAGGTIIYGMVEQNHVAASIDVGFDETDISKEFIDQVLGSGISPRVEGLRIHRVPLVKKGSRVAYVIEIDQAVERAPHQTRDGRYHKRSNFTTQWMEDYEIRDVLRRARSPDLHLAWRLPHGGPQWRDGIHMSDPFVLEAFVDNKTSEPALYTAFHVFLDGGLTPNSDGAYANLGLVQKTVDRGDRTFYGFSRAWMVPANFPLLREQRTVVGRFYLAVPSLPEMTTTSYYIGSSIRAPGCEREEYWMIDQVGYQLTLRKLPT